MSTLDNLRKAAKRWLKALRGGDHEARERFRRAYPGAPAEPGLRDVQHALARERGHDGWSALRRALAEARTEADVEATGGRTHSERVATFLEFACWDHHVHGKGDHAMHGHAAKRLLAQHPEIALDSLYTAVVCGDLAAIERRLSERPEAAREPGGPRAWTPLLYLCYTRFPHQPTIDNSVAIARALLDRGANPNDFYMAGDSSYTALVGVAGEGEQDSPRQPQADALFQLLLERGAEPFDIQVLYNTHFSGDVLWWLRLIYAHTMKTGRVVEWSDPNWAMLDMGGYGPGAHFLLRIAVEKNDLTLAEWLLSHGASPNAATSPNPQFKPAATHYQTALREGFTEMAALLVRYGATPTAPALNEQERFIAACFRLDRDEVRAHLEQHPEDLQSPAPIFAAARKDRADVVEFLLDLGMPIDIQDRRKQRPLHEAAARNALRAAASLIERGANVDPRDLAHNATPLGYAVHYGHDRMIEFLSQVSRDVWTLAFTGNLGRLRDVLREEPELAKLIDQDGFTPLWWVPDDEAKAIEIVELFLSYGADPSIRSKGGTTAGDWALKRGMLPVARRLATVGTTEPAPAAPPPDLEKYESVAQDLVFAYETGHAEAIERLQRHFGRTFTWDELRAGVRELLNTGPQSERPPGDFARAHARVLIARQAGFGNWAELVKALEPPDPSVIRPAASAPLTSQPSESLVDPDVPVEMRTTFPVELQDGVYSTTTEVWDTLTAARDGNLERVTQLVSHCPSLVHCDYNYMRPLHLAVREGHLEVARYLLANGAADPKYVTYPYGETLLTVAEDRGYREIAQLLVDHVAGPDLPAIRDSGDIKYGKDQDERRFQKLVGANALGAVEAMLEQRPELALDEFAFWSEGILLMPAGRANRKMLELLMRYGARVPDVSKWGPFYYFKHDEIAAFLLESGMNAHHRNCHHTTLLHEMARMGDLRKARLLLEHGAAIDAIDQEFRSTPLGLAARWGQRDMVGFLIEWGADPNASGAPWATPLAWARKKGHADIEADLHRRGAR